MRVSVVICTYNGSTRIQSTLQALSRCAADFPVEIVIVDNNSNDGTADVAQQVWAACNNQRFDFRVVRETEPGLTFARRAGIRAARGDIVVFCDDDNWLSPDYLKLAVEIMADPAIGAAGGQSEPEIEGPIPTFIYSHGFGYALGVQGLASGDVTQKRGYLWGAGLTVRRADMMRLYDCPGFPVMTGRTGKKLSAGDDFEICAGLILLGLQLHYDHRLRLRHCIPRERLSPEYLSRLYSGFQEQEAGLRYYGLLKELRSRSPAANALVHGIRWLRWLGSEQRKWPHRFAFLATVNMPSLLSEAEAAFCNIYRNLR